MTEIEIGRGKRARSAYALDDIAVVPSRRTRDPEAVSVSWQIDAYRFDIPRIAAPMDSVVSPSSAVEIGRLGGLAVLDLEGLWTRYDDPEPLLAEIAGLAEGDVTPRLQALYAQPIREDLIKSRIAQIRDGGVTVAASLSPARTAQLAKAVVDAGV
ncbi:MAG: GuaB3 family IMP dehydrogenase-related protein, partial [Candidatus Nanopelagicales bacterium]